MTQPARPCDRCNRPRRPGLRYCGRCAAWVLAQVRKGGAPPRELYGPPPATHHPEQESQL